MLNTRQVTNAVSLINSKYQNPKFLDIKHNNKLHEAEKEMYLTQTKISEKNTHLSKRLGYTSSLLCSTRNHNFVKLYGFDLEFTFLICRYKGE